MCFRKHGSWELYCINAKTTDTQTVSTNSIFISSTIIPHDAGRCFLSVVIATSIIHISKQVQITMYLYTLQRRDRRLFIRKHFGILSQLYGARCEIWLCIKRDIVREIKSVPRSRVHRIWDCKSVDCGLEIRFVRLDSREFIYYINYTWNPCIWIRQLGSYALVQISIILIFHTKIFTSDKHDQTITHAFQKIVRFFE